MKHIFRSCNPSVRTLILLPVLSMVMLSSLLTLWLINKGLGNTLMENEIALVNSGVDEIAALTNTGIPLIDLQRQILIKASTRNVSAIIVARGNPARIIAASKRELIGLTTSELTQSQLMREMGATINTAIATPEPVDSQKHTDNTVVFIQTHWLDSTLNSNTPEKNAIAVAYDLTGVQQKTRQTATRIIWLFVGILTIIALICYGLLHHWVVEPLGVLTRDLNYRHNYPHAGSTQLGSTSREIVTINSALNQLFRTQHSAEKAYIDYVNKLKQSENRLQTIIDSSMDAIICINEERIITVFNRVAENIFGYQSEDILGNPIEVLIPEEFRAAHAQQVVTYQKSTTENFRAMSSTQLPVTGLTADGRQIKLEAAISKTRVDNKLIFTASLRDITDQLKDKERIYHLAFYDQLTGLPNKEHFIDLLQEHLQNVSNAIIAVLYISVNGLKGINDALGHNFGDSALKKASQIIQGALPSHAVLARANGNRFMVSVEVENANQALVLANLLNDKLKSAVWDEKLTPMNITATVGLSLYPELGTEAAQLIQQSHMAMDKAKNSSQYTSKLYDTVISTDAQSQLLIEAHLHRALEKNEFHIAYQPKFDIASCRVKGCEALLRWTNPVLGNVTPDRFIPLAEASGDIIPIGKWVLTEACSQIQKINSQFGLQLQVAVNVSVVQFMCDDLVTTIQQALQVSLLPAHLLVVEMTESLFLENTEHIRNLISALHKLGISLSIDDFGTGYSSLSYLKSLDIDELKIDQSFTRDLPEQTAIVTSMLQVANGFNLNVVAEGIETAEQLAWLQQAGCSTGQGYFYARPLALEDFSAFIRTKIDH